MLSKMTTIIGEMRVFPTAHVKVSNRRTGSSTPGSFSGCSGKGNAADEAYKAVRRTRWLRLRPTRAFATVSPNDGGLRNISMRPPWRTPSICIASCGMSMRFSTACLARTRRRIGSRKNGSGGLSEDLYRAGRMPFEAQGKPALPKTESAIEFSQSRFDASSEPGLRRAQLRRRKLKSTLQIRCSRNKFAKNYSTRCT